ncbi:MAG: VTT domain-containing protein [Patescibacteria group bacterium]
MFDLITLIKTVGYLGLFSIIFAESGLFFGFFLPGDSLLFTAGLLASQGWLNIWWLISGTFIAAVAGDSVGYAFGYRVGPKIFNRPKSILFHPEQLERSKIFFDQHGGKTIILARFIPFVRTFAPILAGVGKMKYSYFLTYNIIGGVLWAIGVTLIGYYLGSFVPHVDKYLWPIIILILLTSVLPSAVHVIKDPNYRRQLLISIKKFFHYSKII